MSRKHSVKYHQKYYIFFSFATVLILLYACSSTKKVPDGEYLLTKNAFKYEGSKLFDEELLGYVGQKPNKKDLLLVPFGLWMYNAANPKYDSILNDYLSFPSGMRNQQLLDSLSIKYNHPEYKGKNLFFQKLYHNWGKAPVIYDQSKSIASALAMKKYLVYRGYWDAKVDYKEKLDSSAKKAEVTYNIVTKDPTYISGYYYNIPDPNIKSIYESNLEKTVIKNKQILDQTNLEKEVKRINDLMKDNGYYNFNDSNQDIYFVADSLKSKKQVPLTLELHKDEKDTPYKKTTVDSISVYLVNNATESQSLKKVDSTLFGIHFFDTNKKYKEMSIWRAIISKRGNIYNQRELDQTKRNLYAMNNFSVSEEIKQRPDNDSIIDLKYTLVPLDKYNFRVSTDVNYSQILNWGLSPSIDLTTRNVFGGAENLLTSVSGTFGQVQDPKNPSGKILAYDLSSQVSLSIPKLLLPGKSYYKLIPKRYSPSSSINLGASIQNNIGLGRIGFNAGLTLQATVNNVVTHRLSLFNTQFSLTRNKDKYYDYFTGERTIVSQVHDAYFDYNPAAQTAYESGQLSFDGVSDQLAMDDAFLYNYLSGGQQNIDLYESFLQSLTNKDRQTQDVLVSSLMYNFLYNEVGNKNYTNPWYVSAGVEVAGNMLGLFSKNSGNEGVVEGTQKRIFGIPYSQFVKFDFDVRKYIGFYGTKNTLVLRQFIGLGIPYGNSTNMPFIRSYFNGGSNDIRAWRVFGGLGPSDVQLDEKVRAYIMDNVKLTTNIEYRMPFNKMWEGAAFVDAGNIWSLKDSGYGDQFSFKKFISQMGVGAGLGIRLNIAYITVRLDAAYKVYDPNVPVGQRWVIKNWKPLQPVLNFAFGYPF